MNNYTWLQQKLHQFALSSQFMRETAFELEHSNIEIQKKSDKNIFVAGLARSGTTILLNAIFKSDLFASLTYKDMPFVLAPNLWSHVYPEKNKSTLIERAHKDGIKISTASPEAFEEVFWKTFDDSHKDSIIKFKTYIQSIKKKYNKNRYLSKNNQNIKRLELISSIFPSSVILVPFRNPLQHANSLLNQHKKFLEYSSNDKFISKYMSWIGHEEFGPNYKPFFTENLYYSCDLEINHWLEQWHRAYQKLFLLATKSSNIHLVSYEKLCDSISYWHQILDILDISEHYHFSFNESIKVVNEEIDSCLVDKSMSLYQQLNSY